jgi:riboflavin kinase/FMN adenylyltransferase
MRHYWSLDDVHLQDSWLTIGTFDGVHIGHQEIVRSLSAKARADGTQAVVLTFYPHPAIVLQKRDDPFYLTTPEERAEILGEIGADVVITHPFTPQIASTSAHTFISTLKSHTSLVHLMVGPDFALGRDRGGDIHRLEELGKELNYTVSTVNPVKVEGEVVSSSRIRRALANGDLDQVKLLLGRPYFVSGQVVPGDGRGHEIGIPTANLSLWMERALPKSGVYVSQSTVNGRTYGAVTNVGVRPTFTSQSTATQVETHLLNFNEPIYGQEIKVNFLTRLRDEKRFPNVQALLAQINQDISQAEEILSAFGS